MLGDLYNLLLIGVGVGLIVMAFTTPGVQFLMAFGGGALIGIGLSRLVEELKYG